MSPVPLFDDDAELLEALPDFTRQDLITARRFLRVYYSRFEHRVSEIGYRELVALADTLDRLTDPDGPMRRPTKSQ